MRVSAFAPAKVNLTLHVTGRRPDGYHLLDSLVVFASVGDRIDLSPADGLTLSVDGPEAEAAPRGPENSVLRAAAHVGARVNIALWKVLPAQAGLGGGSADAAATLRALAYATGRAVDCAEVAGAEALGADVPVCLRGLPARMSGIGEVLAGVPPLPPAWLVLVNPRVPVSTPAAFAALARRANAPMPPGLPRWTSAADLAGWLSAQRNDLQPAASRLAPAIGRALAALRQTAGCHLARMSGSGATCFGLFADRRVAEAAAARLRAHRPDWWIEAGHILREAPAVRSVAQTPPKVS